MNEQQKINSLRYRYGKAQVPGSKRGPMGGHGPGVRMSAGKGGPKDSKKIISRFLHYPDDDKPKMILTLFCTIINTLVTLASSYMLWPIINKYIAPVDRSRGDAAGLAGTLVVLVLTYVFGVCVNYLQSRIILTVAQNTLQEAKDDLFTKMQRLPVRFHDTSNNGDLIGRFTNDMDTIEQMLNSALARPFAGALSTVRTLVPMLYINIWLTLVTIALTLVVIKAGGAAAGRSQKYFSAQQSSLSVANDYIEKTIAGQGVVKVFCHEEITEGEFRPLNRDLRENQIKAQFFGGIMGSVVGNLSQVNYSLTAAASGLLRVLRGSGVGGLTILLNLSRQFGHPISEISMQTSNMFSALVGAGRMFSAMDEEPEPVNDEDAAVLDPMISHVVLDHVTFGYNENRTILKDINPYAKSRRKTAFVGSTDADKTAITNLLNRFYDIQSSEITISGVNICHTERNNLRQSIAMAFQDTHLFTGTVQENIHYGRLGATNEEMIQAAKTASTHSSIMHLPHSYNTTLDGNRANLNQGQRQLLNITRAAISKASILILDEATSSVDTGTEERIEYGMDRLMADRTTLMVIHRPSTVRNANTIVMLEHGEIIERDDHDELLVMKDRYYELYTELKEPG